MLCIDRKRGSRDVFIVVALLGKTTFRCGGSEFQVHLDPRAVGARNVRGRFPDYFGAIIAQLSNRWSVIVSNGVNSSEKRLQYPHSP
jgi:hypothetical protein